MYRATVFTLWVFISLFLRTAYTDRIVVGAAGPSSITLQYKIKYPEDANITTAVQSMTLQYTAMLPNGQYSPSELEPVFGEDNRTGYYHAVDGRYMDPTPEAVSMDNVYDQYIQGNWIVTLYNGTSYIVTVFDLPYPNTTYAFAFTRTLKVEESYYSVNRTTRKKVRTALAGPPLPPMPTTSFRIHNVDHYIDFSRHVTIYWAANPSHQYQYEIRVFKEGQSTHLDLIRGNLSEGNFSCFIGQKRYIFRMRTASPMGYSEASSDVYIPAQDDILEPPPIFSIYDKEEKVKTLTWEKPENFVVEDYTLFWVEGDEKFQSFNRVRAVRHVEGNRTSVKVYDDGRDLMLAMSFNTNESSSGMHLSRPIERPSVLVLNDTSKSKERYIPLRHSATK